MRIHFDRHLRVIEALLSNEAAKKRELVEQSRSEVAKLLSKQAAAEAGADQRWLREFFEDAVVSYGERLSAALLAAVLSENHLAAKNVDARQCVITDGEHGCANPLMAETIQHTKSELERR